MKTDTVNTEKWKIDKTGINLFIDEGDWQVCEIGKDNDTNRGNAELIIAAINACKEINPDNPLNVAKSIPELMEALITIKKIVDEPKAVSLEICASEISKLCNIYIKKATK